MIKRKENTKGEWIDKEKYVERNAIEGLLGNMKRKLDGVVYAFREDIARILVLVRFLIYNLLVVLFLPYIFRRLYAIFSLNPSHFVLLFPNIDTVPPIGGTVSKTGWVYKIQSFFLVIFHLYALFKILINIYFRG